jgi:L-2,4-diaminobutyrate decarboxylase
MFEEMFLSAKPDSRRAYREAVGRAAAAVAEGLPRRPYSGRSAAELNRLLGDEPCPREGAPVEEVLRRARGVIENSVVVSHPFTAAHLHCPPLVPALAAEVVLSALNQSMDSFDQAPAATVLEQQLVDWLCREVGLPATAAGTLTPGGTISNYMGLLLARDAWCCSRLGWSVRRKGLPPEARRFRVLCSEMAHFSVEKSAAQLGLGADAVVPVASDRDFRLCPDDLDRQLRQLAADGLIPLAVVATAGTTDFGSIDPLAEVAGLARAAGAWLHVDAAYGGALLLSPRHRRRLDGLELADSVTLDFHKLFWQPISAGAFLVRDEAVFETVRLHADYLNPEGHEDLGIPDLVTRSVLTTRRFDALKLWFTLQTLGRRGLAALIDRTLELTAVAASAIRRWLRLELMHEPSLSCVVFRYWPLRPNVDAGALNDALRRRLFDTGQAVIGHTRVRGESCLKLTLLNPCAEPEDVVRLIGLIVREGMALERALPAATQPEGPRVLRA